MFVLETIRVVDVIEFLGTFAFAISGIRLASAKKFDWFGAFVVGFVTAIGGGTVRDLLIGVTPFWLQNSIYLWCTLLALIAVVIFHRQVIRFDNTIFIFDCIGLGLFVVVGTEKTLSHGFDPWVAVIMGTMTGAMGGMIRDILINEIPLIFRKEIYALACVIGGVIFTLGNHSGLSLLLNEIITAMSVILIRIFAVKYHWHLPILKGVEDK